MAVSAELLLRARREAGLSQAALGRRAGIPRSVPNTYERGKRQPGADALARILEAAGFRLELIPRIDPEWNAVRLAQVLDLAESLPYRPRRSLAYPSFRRRVG